MGTIGFVLFFAFDVFVKFIFISSSARNEILLTRIDTPANWMRKYANAWRATGDHHDNWESTSGIIEQVATMSSHAGPGGWNVWNISCLFYFICLYIIIFFQRSLVS